MDNKDRQEIFEIDRFEGPYRFLSNFYPSPVQMYGITWPSVEHAYQAAKIPRDHPDRDQLYKKILNETAGVAKKTGRKVPVRADWETFKLEAMAKLIARKFENPNLCDMLVATGDAKLVEGNYWGDTFWGVCKGVGQNHLGRILMNERSIRHQF